MTRSKVIAKKRFKTKVEFTGSGSRLHLKKCSFGNYKFNSLNMMLSITLKLLIEP